MKEILSMREIIPLENRNKYLRYYYRNKGNILEKMKSKFTKEEQSKINKENYLKNRDKILGYKKKHREKFKEELAQRAKIKRASAIEKPTYYLKKYGMSKDDYAILLKKQNGGCAICSREEKGRRLAVDHCHSSGKVRGLLCAACNTTLGKFNDDYELLEKAVLYLKNYL